MNWDTQRDVVDPIIRRNVELERENAALRARLAEVEGELAHASSDLDYAETACGELEAKLEAAEARATRAEHVASVLQEHIDNNGTCVGPECRLHHSLERAEAELSRCAADRDEWMRECVKAQGQRDEARGKCERLERLLKAERALSEELGVTETWKVLVGAHGHPDHVAMWEEYNAALAECGERA